MTVSTTTAANSYLGNGAVAIYAFSFLIHADSDLRVTKEDDGGNVSTLTLTTDYTVSGAGNAAGGTITLTAGNLPNGYTLVIARSVDFLQQTSLPEGSRFQGSTIERVFDRLCMMAQQLLGLSNRSIKLPASETSATDLPAASARAGLGLIFDANGDPTVGGIPSVSSTTPGAWDSTPVKSTGSTTYRTLGTRFSDILNVKDYGAVGDGSTDDTAAIQAAIDGLLGSSDVFMDYSGNYYSAKPSQVLFFPAGIYNVSARLLVAKNNVMISGSGWSSSVIRYVGASIINEVIKFKEANSCGMRDIGIDGGMPFNPTRSETYGAKAGVALDLTPFFNMKDVWIANTRLQGIRCIHVWESYFENIQIRNTGHFSDGTLAGRGAAIHFSNDPAQKESSDVLGAGYESSNIVFVKAKLVSVGCLVRCDVLAANITFISPITENRDFPSFFYALGESKYYINNSDNFVIKDGYCYGHEHSFACNAKLFEIVAQNPGLHIDGFYWYAPRATGGYHPEITTGFEISALRHVQIDNFIINDANGSLTTPLKIDAGGALASGSVTYVSPSTVAPSSLFTTTTINQWRGRISVVNNATNARTEWEYSETERKFDRLAGITLESFQCRAWVKFNGATGSIIGTAKNVASVTRNGAGNYSVFFTDSMPDADYCAIANCNASATGAERAYVAGQAAGNCNVVSGVGAGFADCSVISVVVFR